MKQGISARLTAAFLLIALLLLGAFNWTKPRILVLQSFSQQLPVVKKMDEGIRQTLSKDRQPISVQWHYLEMDRWPDEENRHDAALEGIRAIDHFDPDVVIAVDDEAQEYVAKQYASHKRPKIVFAGINREPEDYAYLGSPNVTGIIETLPLHAVHEMLLLLRHREGARIAVLSGAGPTAAGRMQQVASFNWAPHRLIEANLLDDFVSWQSTIKNMEGKADVVLLLTDPGIMVSPTNHTLVPSGEVIRWTEANSKPLPIGMDINYVIEGGGLSVISSSQEIGASAASEGTRPTMSTPVTAETLEVLHKTFVTPFDRDDIHQLITHMDDILDLIEDSAQTVSLYDLKAVTPEAKRLAELCLFCTEKVREAVGLLEDPSKARQILDICTEIDRLESDADHVLRAAMSKLFREEPDVRNLIKLKAIYELLEIVTDRCEDVANTLESIIVENAML